MRDAAAVLDDEEALHAADPGGLLDSYLRTGEQLLTAYRAAAEQVPPIRSAASVTFCAMGGSATAGDVVVGAYGTSLPFPAGTVRGYRLPAHCGPDDVVVCVSYSGNTEETLATYAEAVARGCRVVAVCSSGELADRAGADGMPAALVPAGIPQPRAALGALVGGVLGALRELVPAENIEPAAASIASLAERLAPGIDPDRNLAKGIVSWLEDRIPVVWGSEGVTEAAAFRWKAAFNENAKIPAFASVLPELDHHEVAGWSKGWGERFHLVVLRHEDEHETVEARVRATIEAIDGSGLESHHEVHAPAGPPLAAALSLMMLGDCASAYHAMARGIDPAPIEAIARVKARLAERR
jgi:glucose/mannose-6-phosphate isomerase